MKSVLEIIFTSWVAMGFAKVLVIAVLGGALIACLRQRNLASSLWAGLMLMLPIAFFSGLLPLSWKALPGVAREVAASTSVELRSAPQPVLSEMEPTAVEEPVSDIVPVPMEEIVPAAQALTAVSAPEQPRLSREQWLICAWLVGGIATLLPGLRSLLVSRRLRRVAAPTEIQEMWQELAGDAAGFVPVRISADLDAPGVISALRPEVVLPASALEWRSGQLLSVLRHEYHHVRRRDLLVRWLGRLVRALLWFHPAVWWVQSRLVLAQERAADEAVVAAGVPAADYAGHLLETASGACLFPGIPMARKSQLGGRIRVLLSRQRDPGMFRRVAERCTAFGFAVLAVLAALLGFATPEKALADSAIAVEEAVRVPIENRAGEATANEEKGFRGSILDRRGAIIATSDPEWMPEALKAKPPLRWYPDGKMVGHLSGFVLPDKDEKLTATKGTGLEDTESLAQGKALRSTIDLRIQRLAWQELEKEGKPGSILVMDPRSGEVLALASWPSVDPNHYADGVSDEEMRAWQEDPQKPLLNHAFEVQPPGSLSKLILTLGAAGSDLLDRRYHCDGLFKTGRLQVPDLHGNLGDLDFRSALMKGSNIYFAKLALDLGHENTRAIWDKISVVRSAGAPWQMPAAVWLPDDESTRGELLGNVALGRPSLLSLLDVASVVSAIADGSVCEPSFVAGNKQKPPVTLAGLGVDERELQLIRKTLRDAVNEKGAGLGARVDAFDVAGIPSTAVAVKHGRYVYGKYIASFHAYAPAEQPKYMVAVRIEGSSKDSNRPFFGGTVAGPIAGRLLHALVRDIE